MRYAYNSWFFIAEKLFHKQFSVLSTICNMGRIFVFRGEQKHLDRLFAKLNAGGNEIVEAISLPDGSFD